MQSWAGGLSKTPKGGCDSFVIEYCDRQETKPTTWARTGTGFHGSAREGTSIGHLVHWSEWADLPIRSCRCLLVHQIPKPHLRLSRPFWSYTMAVHHRPARSVAAFLRRDLDVHYKLVILCFQSTADERAKPAEVAHPPLRLFSSHWTTVLGR